MKTGGATSRTNGVTRKNKLMREVVEMHLVFPFLHMDVLQYCSSFCHYCTDYCQGLACVLLMCFHDFFFPYFGNMAVVQIC